MQSHGKSCTTPSLPLGTAAGTEGSGRVKETVLYHRCRSLGRGRGRQRRSNPLLPRRKRRRRVVRLASIFLAVSIYTLRFAASSVNKNVSTVPPYRAQLFFVLLPTILQQTDDGDCFLFPSAVFFLSFFCYPPTLHSTNVCGRWTGKAQHKNFPCRNIATNKPLHI